MTKTVWSAHCHTFLSQSDTSAKARKAYSLDNGVNDNSFRRELTKYKKAVESEQLSGADQKPASKADQKPRSDQKASKEADQKSKPDQKAPPAQKEKLPKNQQPTKNTRSKGRVAKADQGKSDQNGQSPRARANSTRPKGKANVIRHPDGTCSFAPGNTASLIHGGYAEKVFLNPEVQAMAEMPISDMHQMMKSRFALMEMIRTDVIRQTQIDYENGRAHTKEVFEDGELVQIPMTYEEAIFSSMLAGGKEQTKLYDSVMKAEQTQQSLLMQYRKMSRFTHEEATEEIESVLERYQADQLTAIEAGMLLEGKGIKLPVTLKGLIEREIEELEPKGSGEEGGLTEEQLNEIRAQALKFEQEEDDKVAENHAVLLELLKENDDGV